MEQRRRQVHTTLQRQLFFDNQVHTKVWKDAMSGANEKEGIRIIESAGYIHGKDFVRQHPIGERFVLDFAFIHEQVAIEIDGKNHTTTKQKGQDRKRDAYLRTNNWVPIRINDGDLKDQYRRSFFKSLLKEVVEERRAQWETGRLYEIDIPNYVEADFY